MREWGTMVFPASPSALARITSISRRFLLSPALFVFLAISLVAPMTRGQTAAVDAKLGPILKGQIAELKASESVRFSVMIEPDAAALSPTAASKRETIRVRQQEVLDRLPAGRLDELRRYENLSAFAGRGGAAAISALAAHPWVTSIYADRKAMASLAQGVPLTGADQAAAVGVSGSGVSVAVIDSGIDTDHPDLLDDIVEQRCWCVGSPSPVSGCCPNGGESMSGAGAAEDDSGHGTNVSGIVTSGGVVAASGVAPDAGIVAIKTLDGSGGGSFSDVDAALDWLITNYATYGVRVVNLSLSDGTEHANPLAFPCTGSVTTNAVDALEALGVAVVVASGNDAYDAGIAFPSCIPSAISVGGVYDANIGSISWCSPSTCVPALCTDSTTAADQFVCHTNSSGDLDVLAPDWRTHTSAMGGGATNFGGTSASAPYVSGLAALLIQQDPSRTPSDLLSLMISDAPLVVNPDNGLSFPRADVSTAFSVCGDGSVSGSEECDDGNVLAGDCCSVICEFEAAGSSCDDGDACTATDQCDGAGACNQVVPVVCDNGQFCDGAETCDALLGCQVGTPVPVDDGIGCTDDSCDEIADAVVNEANDGLCDNLQFCDGAETCDVALDCQAGTPVPVDDGIGCTDDSCDEVADAVVNEANDGLCDNLQFCDGAETCDVALDCQAGTPVPVDDGIGCTDDSCDEVADAVVNAVNAGACDDGDPCTAEACDALTGCSNTPIPGCAVPVPVGGSGGAILLILALLVAGLRGLAPARC